MDAKQSETRTTIAGQEERTESRGVAHEDLRSSLAISQVLALLEHAPIPVALLDRDARYLGVSAAHADLHDVPPGEQVGRTVHEVVPTVWEQIEGDFRRCIAERQRVDSEVHAHGAWWRSSLFPVVDGDGAAIGAAVISVDISAERELAGRRALDEVREQLCAFVAHELRNPLTVLLAEIEALDRRMASAHRADGDPGPVQTMRHATSRLTRVVANMLALGRLSGHEPEIAPLRLIHVVRRSVQDARSEMESAREILVHMPPDLPLVEADEGMVEEVVVNLLTNAAKYSPLGLPIEIEAHPVGDAVHVGVLDRGPGIDVGEAEEIFTPFRRGLAIHDEPGLGLGLAVCRALVDAQGGAIWYEPREGGGSAFWFTLPLCGDGDSGG